MASHLVLRLRSPFAPSSMAESGPLTGLTIVVTRARTQASVLSERLEQLGAVAVGIATIEIAAPQDGGAALRSALLQADRYDQLVVASPNGARRLAEMAASIDELNEAALPPVACVGPSTAAKLDDSPFEVSHIPDRNLAEGLVDSLGSPVAGSDRLLLVQAEVARNALEAGMSANGWSVERVDAYRTIDAAIDDQDRERARAGDLVTFTSSSTVERYLRLVGRDLLPPTVASIGPITSTTARDLGVTVDIEADPHTIDGLIAAIERWATAR